LLPRACEKRKERRLEARDVEDEAARRSCEDGLERRRRRVERRGDTDDVGGLRVLERPAREAARRARGIGHAHGEPLAPEEAREEPAHPPRPADEEESALRAASRLHRVRRTNLLPTRRKTPAP